MSFSIPDPTGASAGLTYTTSMPQIAGKKITLSFSPATANDQAVIESFLPSPHADGTPIQPSELPSSFPAYLINLKPELRIDGQVVATGAAGMMGSIQSFTMTLNEPGIGVSNIYKTIKTGEYYGIGVDTGRIGSSRQSSLNAQLAATVGKMQSHAYQGLTKDVLVGDLLYTTMIAYFAALDTNDETLAMTQGTIRYRATSVGIYSLLLGVNEVFGIPVSAGSNGMLMDVGRIMQAVFSKNGNMNTVKQYMLASGAMSSALENYVPEQIYSTQGNVQGISAVKALKIANDQGIPLFTINQSNINSVLSELSIDADDIAAIVNAVNAGKEVTVSKSNINFNGWIGCGYIISDPATGAGAYMISGDAKGARAIWGLDFIAVGIDLLVAAMLLTDTPIAATTQGQALIAALAGLAIFYIGLGLCVLTGDTFYASQGAAFGTALGSLAFSILAGPTVAGAVNASSVTTMLAGLGLGALIDGTQYYANLCHGGNQ